MNLPTAPSRTANIQPALCMLLVFALLLSSAILPLRAQQAATPTPSAPTQDEQETAEAQEGNEVVRITTNLVQVDTVVTDRDGRQVTDLKAEDFEIYENDKPQRITNFSYVSINPPAASPAPANSVALARSVAPLPPVARLRPEQVRRTIALVVDDLGLSFESTARLRRSLREFVDERMGTRDLVAIIRTSAGAGALQQFTSDRSLLYAAIDRVRWYPTGRGGVAAFAPMERNEVREAFDAFDQRRGSSVAGALPAITPNSNAGERDRSSEDARERRRRASGASEEDVEIDGFRTDVFTVGTLGALNFVVRGLQVLPGRKSVVLFSDGLNIYDTEGGRNVQVLEGLRRLVDLATRASVVFYTVDARGLQTLGLTAADNAQGRSSAQLVQALTEQRTNYIRSQDALNYLAAETGGFFVHDSNDLSKGVRRVLDDQRGFYLIGYRPDEATFETSTGRRRFQRLRIEVKNRPELKVRTRTGFYNFAEADALRAPRGRDRQISEALASPFSAGGVGVRLTSLYGNTARDGDVVTSLLHIEAKDLKFTEGIDGWQQAVVDIVAVYFTDRGYDTQSFDRTETIRARGEVFDNLQRDGLTLLFDAPVKKPGAYQLRVAVRDTMTERTGSASRFIEVPNLKRDRLAVSGIYLSSDEVTNSNVDFASASATTNLANSATNSTESGDAARAPTSGASPAVRRFRTGAKITYLYDIYNARRARDSARPQLTTQLRLYRDNQLAFEGRLTPFDPGTQKDYTRLRAGARLTLGTNLLPGEYTMQVVVNDLLAKEKHRIASQWIDFEIVP